MSDCKLTTGAGITVIATIAIVAIVVVTTISIVVITTFLRSTHGVFVGEFASSFARRVRRRQAGRQGRDAGQRSWTRQDGRHRLGHGPLTVQCHSAGKREREKSLKLV